MAWHTSTRRQRLPTNWATITKRIKTRDNFQCTKIVEGKRCTAKATDVDHIIPNDDDSDTNLTSLCRPHHAAKSSHEGNQALAARRARLRLPTEPHPGLPGGG